MAGSDILTSRLGGVRPDLVAAITLAVFIYPITVGAAVQAAPEVDPWMPYATVALFASLHVISCIASRRPAGALVAGSAIMLALAFLPFDDTATAAMLPSSLAYLFIVLISGRAEEARIGRAGLALGVLGAFVIVAAHRVVVPAGPLHDDLLVDLFAFASLTAAVVAMWAIGRLIRAREMRRREREAVRIRDAIAVERRNISRDLHDIVSHSMTVMIAQAEAGSVVAQRDPAAAIEILERIGDVGREAMRDMRSLLDVLNPGGDDATLAPTPGIADLPALIDGAAGRDREISLTETGERGSLARDAELAVHRTVQEAITNAVRHVKPPVHVDVRLAWTPACLDVEIADDGGQGPIEPSRLDGAGHGLIGMRERITRAGGTLEIVRAGGWTVRAKLPTTTTARR